MASMFGTKWAAGRKLLWDRNRHMDCWQRNTVRRCTGTVDRCSDVSLWGCVDADTASLLKCRVLWTVWPSYWTVFKCVRKICEKRHVCPSVCASARVNLIFTGRIFMKFDIWGLFENLLWNWSFIKIGQEQRILYMNTNLHFRSYIAQFVLEWKTFQTEVVEKLKTHILRWITFFFRKSRLFEIIWKNIVELDRPRITIWRMCFACWMCKATHVHYLSCSDYNNGRWKFEGRIWTFSPRSESTSKQANKRGFYMNARPWLGD